MPLRRPSVLLALSLAALHFGCQPGIGEDCKTSVDCSQTGDRLCDVTQPGGYCTVFNCEPNSCPGDSTCIAFNAALSPLAGCADSNGLSRFERTFCMAECESDDDCRRGYVCGDLGAPNNAWNALVIDRDRSARVCIVPASVEPVPSDRATDVCNPPAAGAGGDGG